MTDEISQLRRTAEEAARAAGTLLRTLEDRPRTVATKSGPGDLVTDADQASDTLLQELLRARHPDHAILSEESGQLGEGSYRWIIDPLDGTKLYAHRYPGYTVSIAVEGPGGLLAGAIYDPRHDEMFTAARGAGATLNGQPVRVSSPNQWSDALVCMSYPTGLPHDRTYLDWTTEFISCSHGNRRSGSAALDLAYLAAGRLDAMWVFQLMPWDLAAGVLIAEEAGARLSAGDGGPFELMQGGLMCSGPGLFDQLRTRGSAFLRQRGWARR